MLSATLPFVVAADSASATITGAVPPWEPDGNASAPYGNILFYDANGNQVTGGSNLSNPFAYAVASTPADSGSTKATLAFGLPQKGVIPSNWNQTTESGTTTFNPSSKLPVSTPADIVAFAPTYPVVVSTADISAWLGGHTPDTNQGYANTIEVRLQDTLIQGTTTYWDTDIAYNTTASPIMIDETPNGGSGSIAVPANSWVQIFPSASSSTTTLTSTLPNPQKPGTPIPLRATISASSTTGSVNFYNNGTFIGNAPVSAGVADFTDNSPAAGDNPYTASFIPGPAPGDETGMNTSAASIVDGSTSSIFDMVVTSAASVAGTVTSSASSSPLPSVCVYVLDSGGNVVAQTKTGSDGSYLAWGMGAGTYTIEFDAYDCGGGNYATQWYNGSTSQGSASGVTLTSGQNDTGINAALAPLTYVPLTPFRVLDTRNGTGAPQAQLGPNGTIAVQITGVDGIPDTATAVALNLTAVNATATGTHLTVWPDGNTMPVASNLNVHSPASIANFDIVGIGSGTGKIDINNTAGNVDVIADIAGYYVSSNYTPVVPFRVLDTRNGTGAPQAQVGPNGTLAVQITGADGGLIPVTAKAVALNLTAVNATATGTHLTVWPDGNTMPVASNLNIHSPASIANFDVVGIGSDGKIDINNTAGSIDVIADIAGYYTGTAFVPIVPFRALDTRNGTGTGGPASPLGPNGVLSLQLRGVGGIPSNATAVAMNVTAVNATAAGTHLTVWPDGLPAPTASNLNIHSSLSIANFDIAALGPDGKIDISNLNGNVDVIGDVEGYQIG